MRPERQEREDDSLREGEQPVGDHHRPSGLAVTGLLGSGVGIHRAVYRVVQEQNRETEVVRRAPRAREFRSRGSGSSFANP
jgi:hypothetical protein